MYIEFLVGLCSAGYYCTSGAVRPDPTDGVTGNICPFHHICVEGTAVPEQCPDGYHANAEGLDACVLCPAGSLCRAGVAPVSCPQGKDNWMLIYFLYDFIAQ